jgi:arabinofuranosyltransferase
MSAAVPSGSVADAGALEAGRVRLLFAAGVAVSMFVLIAHSLVFNFVTDDAFISFVYSRNLAQHGQLVFNLGERVEGYTNFLWTVILAAGLRIGVPPEWSSRVLGTLCGALGLLVAARLHGKLRGQPAVSLWDVLPALILAGISGYACWSSGGLETQLFTLLVTAGISQYLTAQLDEAHAAAAQARAALFFGLSALTRPEGYLFFGLCGLHQLFTMLRAGRYLPSRAELRALGIFLLLTVPHLLFRRAYYGYWVPNTFYVKSAGGPGTLLQGGYYVFAFARDLKLFVLPGLWLLGLLRPTTEATQRRYLLAGGVTYLLTTVFLGYVISVGGDFMGLYRFVLPIVPCNVVCGVLGLHRLLSGRRPIVVAAALFAGLFLHAANSVAVDRHATLFIGADRGIDTPGFLRHYTEDRAAIGKWLGQHVQPDDFQVVGGAGAQVYYAGIRALDSFGLADAYVAHNVPPVSVRPGHQKFAPVDYILSRKPTIITYNIYRIDSAPYTPSYTEAATWRARGFHFVSVRIPGLSRPYYSFLKRLDRRLGPLPPEGLD